MTRNPIEEIVKLNVPFSGTFENMKIPVKKRRFIVPAGLRKTYRLRQRKESIKQCISFVTPGRLPVIATMKDNPSEKECSEYIIITFDKQGRFIMPFNIHGIKEATYIGHRDYIEIRASNPEY